jgi:hypothetical protein
LLFSEKSKNDKAFQLREQQTENKTDRGHGSVRGLEQFHGAVNKVDTGLSSGVRSS